MISKEDGKLIVTFGMDLYKRASIKVGDYSDSHKRDWKNWYQVVWCPSVSYARFLITKVIPKNAL